MIGYVFLSIFGGMIGGLVALGLRRVMCDAYGYRKTEPKK